MVHSSAVDEGDWDTQVQGYDFDVKYGVIK